MSAGRPRIFRNVMRFFSANMTPKHIEIARLIGDGNCSKAVRVALIHCIQIGYPRARHALYIDSIFSCRTHKREYGDRPISVRITIPDEMRQMAMECGNSVSKGIRVALELYGLSPCVRLNRLSIGQIDGDVIKKLDIIRKGLYKIND